MPIDELSVVAVRGIRQRVTLPLKGKSLALRGDNGTGKSSFVAALRWALRNERSVGPEDASTSEFWHHQLEKPEAAVVTVSLRGGGTIKIDSNGVEADEKGEIFRRGCLRANPFLPRRQLLKFLEDKPGDRFQYLESFLDLDQADEIQQVFVRHATSALDASKFSIAERDRLLGICASHLPKERRTRVPSWSALVAVLGDWAKELGLQDTNRFDALLASVEPLRSLLAGEELGRARERMDRVRAPLIAWASIELPKDPTTTLAELRRLEESATDATLADLVKLATDHFETHPVDGHCPVCAQNVVAVDVLANLRARGEALKELRDTRRKVSMLGNEWFSFIGVTRSAVMAARAELGETGPLGGVLAGIPQAADVLKRVDGNTEAVVDELTSTVNGYVRLVDGLLANLPTTQSVPDLRTLVAAVDAANDAQLAISVADSAATSNARRGQDAKAIAEALRRARQDVAQTLLNDISKHVAEYYRDLHPTTDANEATGAPTIEIQRHQAGTAHVRGEFANKRIEDPRLVYSDGHLDTVGICVFLALRRFRADRDRAADPKLMVLDDIVLSVDLAHATRLLDLLAKKFDDHQVLILTHNGAFFEWCMTRLPSYERLAIRGWSLEGGVEFGDYDTGIEGLIKQLAATASSKLLAQAIMNVIDPWMSEARYVYGLTLKSKRNDSYTLGDYWPAFVKAMKDLAKDLKAPIGDVHPLIEQLKELVNVRNRLAAHDNDFAKEFPLGMVQNIAENVLKLVAALYCAQCNRFAEPTPQDSPVRVACRCETLFYNRPRKSQTTES